MAEYVTKKDLSVGYATAAEVAASRQGDCSEHAVLAAAMCRAVGLPARVVVGYAYVPEIAQLEHVFVGHAWIEAYVGEKWMPLDPALEEFGPGHIAQAVGDGQPSDFFEALGTMGKFEITEVSLGK